jgi:hypothetical protein
MARRRAVPEVRADDGAMTRTSLRKSEGTTAAAAVGEPAGEDRLPPGRLPSPRKNRRGSCAAYMRPRRRPSRGRVDALRLGRGDGRFQCRTPTFRTVVGEIVSTSLGVISGRRRVGPGANGVVRHMDTLCVTGLVGLSWTRKRCRFPVVGVRSCSRGGRALRRQPTSIRRLTCQNAADGRGACGPTGGCGLR